MDASPDLVIIDTEVDADGAPVIWLKVTSVEEPGVSVEVTYARLAESL